MTTVSPPGYSTLFSTGLFLSTEGLSGSREATPTPISAVPFERPYIGSATLNIPNYPSRTSRRPKLAALRTHSARASTSSNPPSALTPTSASVPSSPRVPRRRRSSITLAHNPMAAIKSPTRAAGMSGRAQNMLQSLGSPTRERRVWSLDAVGERSFESTKSDENKPSRRRPLVARKPPPTAPLPTPPVLPTLTLNINFPSPNTLSPALTPSPNVLPAPTPGAIELGLHKFSFPNKLGTKPARSPLVTSAAMNHPNPGYFDYPVRVDSPVLPMELE